MHYWGVAEALDQEAKADQNGGYRTWATAEPSPSVTKRQDRTKASQVTGEPIPDARSRRDEHRCVTMNVVQRLR